MEKVLEDVDSNIVYWSNRWDEQKTGWHQNQVDPYLLKHYTTVTGKALPAVPAGSEEFKENSTRTWFIPLSGKTLDIPFLLKLGYKVFGVEAVQKAIETLDQENGFGLSYDEKTSLYTGVEGRLQIYCGDLFQCPIENFGPFEYVWDRGSLVALEYPLRNNYKIMMQRAVKGRDGKCKDCIYHFETFISVFYLHTLCRLEFQISPGGLAVRQRRIRR